MTTGLDLVRSLHVRRTAVALAIIGAAAAVGSVAGVSGRFAAEERIASPTAGPIGCKEALNPCGARDLSLPSAAVVLGAGRGDSEEEASPTF